MAKKPSKKVNKSAVTGEFVSDEEIEKHPKTTYRQTVQSPKKKPPKKS